MKNLEYYRKIFKYVPMVQEVLLRKVNCSDVENFDFGASEWYMEYSWTEEEQEETIELLLEYMKPTEVQREFFLTVTTDKEELRGKIRFLMFNCGWKIK
jgi:hypothetical protein